MGFRDARQRAIKAIEEGRVQHEARDAIDEKNLLATGEVTTSQIIRMLAACRGTQYSCAPHHLLRSVDVHVFKPEASPEVGQPKSRWYIKLYFIDPDVFFVSVHR